MWQKILKFERLRWLDGGGKTTSTATPSPQTDWLPFKPPKKTDTGLYNNDWQTQTFQSPDPSIGTQFKTYEGDIYFESKGQRAGGVWKPDLYAKQLENDMKALQEDISGFENINKQLEDTSPYKESVTSSLEAMNKQLADMQSDYERTKTKATEGYMGFSPYQRMTFSNADASLTYGMPTAPKAESKPTSPLETPAREEKPITPSLLRQEVKVGDRTVAGKGMSRGGGIAGRKRRPTLLTQNEGLLTGGKPGGGLL